MHTGLDWLEDNMGVLSPSLEGLSVCQVINKHAIILNSLMHWPVLSASSAATLRFRSAS